MANNDPLELRLYDTDLTTVLGILGAASTDLYLQMNEPGSGQVKIPLNSNAAAVIASDQFVEVRYRGAVRGGFFVENIGKDEANSAEAGGQWMTISGRGAMLLLDDAIVGDDGTGASTRSFSGTKAGMIIQLIEEAQNRGGLANLDYDFTDTDDSDSVAWDDDEPLDIPVGKSLLDVVRDFAKTGIDFNVLPDGSGNFILSAYKDGIGTDKSSTVYFRIGQNCQEVSHQEAGGDIRNAIKVKYKNGFTTVKDTASISARRRREGFLDVRFAGDLSAAQTFGAAELSLKKDPKKQITVKVNDATGPKAFIKYELGDYIMLDRQGVEESHRVRGMQLSWSDSGFAEIAVDLNSLILENEIRMAQDIEWLKDMWETAHDAGLLEVRFWAAIGDKNIGYSVNHLLVVGDILYVANVSGSYSILAYNLKDGGWTRTPMSYPPVCMASVGSTLYIGAGRKIYKLSSGTLTEVGSATLSGDPGSTFIFCMVAIGNTVYVGGDFDVVDGVTINGMAAYDTVGDAWSDGGGAGPFYVMATDGSVIYASIGGVVKKWNGSWSTLGSSFAPLSVLCLAPYGSELLAGTASNIYLWNGSAWAVFGEGVSGAVWSITTLLTDVYVGGTFTDRGNYIAKYSGGEWFELEEGTNGGVNELVMHGEDLYVAGSFTTAGDKNAQGIAAYYANFDSLANYLENTEGTFNLGEAIHNATAKTSLTGADEMPLWDSISQQLRKITWTNIIASIKTWADTIYVALTGNQTVGGVKTFSSFPVTPSSAPATDYQVANKKYVDDSAGGGGTPGGSDTEIQFNDSGAFAGDPMFTWNTIARGLGIGDPTKNPIAVSNMIWMYSDGGEDPPTHVLTAIGSDPPFLVHQVAGGSFAGGYEAIVQDQIIGRWRGRGWDGTGWTSTRVELRLVADGDWASGDTPTRIELWTCPDGSGTLTLAMTIGSDGNVNIASGKEYRVDGANHLHSYLDLTDTPAIREVLTANRTYYVRTDGSDSNNGLANTSGGAFLTIQKAINETAGLDMSIYDVTINIASGTYAVFELKRCTGAGQVYITGDTTTPSNVIINGGTISIYGYNFAPTRYTIRGMRLTPTSGFCIICQNQGYMMIGNMEFNGGSYGIYADNGGQVAINYNISVSGNKTIFMWALWRGFIIAFSGKTITYSGTPAWATACAKADEGGEIYSQATMSGGATGKRYDATMNGIIQTVGGGANYFPGNVAGATATGGQYA